MTKQVTGTVTLVPVTIPAFPAAAFYKLTLTETTTGATFSGQAPIDSLTIATDSAVDVGTYQGKIVLVAADGTELSTPVFDPTPLVVADAPAVVTVNAPASLVLAAA